MPHSEADPTPTREAEVIDFPAREPDESGAVEVTEVPHASESQAETVEGELVDDPAGERPDPDGEPTKQVDEEVERHLAQRVDWLGQLAERARTRQPVIPTWAASRADAAATLRWVARFYAHVGAYHATRAPLYLARLAARSPVGAGRVARTLIRWALDLEGEPLRYASAQKNDPETYIKLTRQRDRRVRARLIALALLGVPVALTGFMVTAAPAWILGSVVSLVAGVLGWIGRPADRPMINRAVLPTTIEPLTSDVVVRAFGALGIGAINQAQTKGRDGITFDSAVSRDGPGWRADIDLPYGVTATDVMERRTRLASALRRPLGCVWPEGDTGVHEGRLVLWVGDRDLSARGKLTWKLASAGRHDFFDPVPFGEDPRGRPIGVPLFQHNVLIGSLPGQGKTAAVRVLSCGAVLDPAVQPWLHELKGSGDLDPLEPVSHRFVSGIDDASIAYAAESLRLLREEVMRRAPALKNLPRDVVPDKRITRQVADKRSLGLFPLVAVFDECQNLFAHPTYGAQAGVDAEFIIKVGRALGVVLILATQRPDKESLPTGVSANVSIRFCLMVGGQVENDMILGTSAYKNGIRATVFRPEVDAGNGYLKGVSATPTVVRTAYLDQAATERVAQRAHAARTAAGTLTGHAAGQHTTQGTTPTSILDDLLAVWPQGEDKVWSTVLVDRLAELRAETYGEWTEMDDTAKARQLSAALKPLGIETAPVGRRIEGKSVTRYGLAHDTIAEKATERDQKRASAGR